MHSWEFRALIVSGVFVGSLLMVGAPTRAETILSLDECVLIALEKNKALAVAGERVREAEAGVGESRARLLPQLSTKATYTRLDVAPYISLSEFPMPIPPGGNPGKIELGDDDNYTIGLSVQQPLFTGGKVRNGYRASKHMAEAERFRYRQAEADLVLNVRKAYYSLLKVREIEKVARQSVVQMEAHVQDVENLYDAGIAAKNDFLKARVQLSNVRVMEIRATNAVKLAGVALCNLLGIPLDTGISPSTRLTYEPSEPIALKEAVRNGLKKRLEVPAMDHMVKAADRGVAVTRGQWLPDVFLVGNCDFKRPNRENERKFYRSWDVTLAAQWQIFDGGTRRAQTARALSRLEQARKGAEQVRDGITLEVTHSYLSLTEAEQRVKATRENVGQAEENYRVTDSKFKQGMATNTDLLDAQTMLTQVRMDYAIALADDHIARAALEKAMGVQRRE